jgi:CelD/BcsL family acetyltransferase involved in cellulose biosynthesis
MAARRDGTLVAVYKNIAEVEGIWRELERHGVESPGQSFDFIDTWIKANGVPQASQRFVVGYADDVPVALMAVYRRIRKGVRIFSWFPGSHVGCHGPLVDKARLATMTGAERAKLWKSMIAELGGVDLIYLRTMQLPEEGQPGLFDGLGRSVPVETLYRSDFSSWEEANTTQRSKSRRKHDRQQGDRLDALGKVEFEELSAGEEALAATDVMFMQRAKRFKEMGVRDPFISARIRRFYDDCVRPGSKVGIKLHVLRLNGDIVAVRYNIEHGDKLFCLISSMSEDHHIQGGSPGKQCLLRVMQTVFDKGYRTFDMGGGLTDEKRHWCNTQIGLGHHYIPLTIWGRLAALTHETLQTGRARIKANPTLLRLVKMARQGVRREPAAE